MTRTAASAPKSAHGLSAWRRRLRAVLRQPGSPEKIALGMAIGWFITFTPTIGIHIPLVLILSTIFRASRLASLVPIWIANVFTAPPIYCFDYWLGAQVLPGTSNVELHEVWERIRACLSKPTEGLNPVGPFEAFWDVTKDLIGPMMLGGVIVGLLAALISYPLTLRVILWYRNRRRLYLERHPNRLRHRAAGPEA